MPDPIARAALRVLQDRDMTITALADRTGLHRTVLSRWFAGRRSMPLRHAVSVMQALGLTIVEGGQDGQVNGAHRTPPQGPRRPDR